MLEPLPLRTRLVSSPVFTADSPAAAEPVTRVEAKDWVGLADGSTHHNSLIEDLVSGARRLFEGHTGCILKRQVATCRYDGFSLPLTFPVYPVVSISSVKSYYEGSATTETGTFYLRQPDSYRPKIYMASTSDWVATNREELEVACLVGYASGSMPEDIKTVLRYLVRLAYDNPTGITSGPQELPSELPYAIADTIARYKNRF